MRNKILKSLARLMTVAVMVSMFGVVQPVAAGTPTSIKDTLSRNQMSATLVTHNLTGTIPTDTWSSGETLIFTYGGFTAFTAVTPTTCTISTGTLTSCLTSGANVLTLLCATGPCGGTLTVTGANWTSTNPSSAGSNTVTVSGTGGVTGSFALATVDSDQVSVTATVDPSITFDLDTALTDVEDAAPYDVAFGTLTPGTVKSSGASVNSIWVDLATNATSGAVVTVLSANSGLDSAAVPADTIPSASVTMSGAVANYGLCVISVAQGSGGPLAKVAPYNGATCVADGLVNVVGLVNTTVQPIVNTTGAEISTGRARISVNVNATNTTPAHNDYSDTLTFVATGTF